MLVLGLLLTVAPAQTCADPSVDCDCKSLFSLNLANQSGLDSCTTKGVPCDEDDDGVVQPGELCSTNEFLDRVYERPFYGEPYAGQPNAQHISPGLTGSLMAVPVPKCVDGSEDCPGQQLRCVDGTRPLYHVDPAEPVDDAVPNDWVFFFQGGGSCGREGGFTGGEDCWDKYSVPRGRDDMSAWVVDDTGVHVGPTLAIAEGGILKRGAPEWKYYNRVYVPKCTFDRAVGQTWRVGTTAASCPVGMDCTDHFLDPDTQGKPENADGDAFNLAFNGWFVVQAILEDLSDGREVMDWSSGEVKELPALSAAGQVLLAGHSAGAEHLSYILDRIHGELGPETDVRGLFDARGWPGIDNEEARTTGVGDMYDHNMGDVPFCQDCLPLPGGVPPLVSNRSYSADPFKLGSAIKLRDDYWGAQPDSSCVATSPANPWRCRHAVRVIYNHISTPFFLRQDQADPSHLSKPPPYATAANYLWQSLHYASRVREQAETFDAERHNSPGRFREPVYGWADPTALGIGLFMPTAGVHNGLQDTYQFRQVGLSNDGGVTCKSYSDALYDWLNAPGDQVFVENGSIGSTACTP